MVNGLRQKTFIECRYLRLDAWRYRQHGRLFAADRLHDLCNAAFLFPVRSVLAFRLSDVSASFIAWLVAPIRQTGQAFGLHRDRCVIPVMPERLAVVLGECALDFRS